MAWDIPLPTDISDSASGVLESEVARVFQLLNPGASPPPVDARSPTSVLAIYARTLGLTAFDLWLYQARLAQELMPDTAVDWLWRHGLIWGVPQDQPTAAEGNLVLTGPANGVVPAAAAFSAPGGAVYNTINSGTIASSGTLSIGVSAAVAGSAGDLAAGVTLTAVNPLAALVPQTGTIDANGVTGGTDLESTDDWRARILQRIRNRGGGGDASDFEQWTETVLPGSIVTAISPGVGQVTVAIAMPTASGPRVPTSTELAEATAYLNDSTNRKPLGAPVINVIAATLEPVNYTLHLMPDTAAIEQGVSNALGLFFNSGSIEIGGTLDMSVSDAAINLGAGVVAFDRSVPSADVVSATPTSLLTLGSITFV